MDILKSTISPKNLEQQPEPIEQKEPTASAESEESRQEKLDRLFTVCPENPEDLERIKKTLALGEIKYSEEQIQNQEWSQEDLQKAIDIIKKAKEREYFWEIANKYKTTMWILDSFVRLDQEADIAQDLKDRNPVLLRGTYRTGQTTMVRALETHRFGATNSLMIDASICESVSVLEKYAILKVASFISQKEIAFGQEVSKETIVNKIKESGKSPFIYLNEYFQEKDEKVFLSFDEVMRLIDKPEGLKYLADLKNLDNIQLAIILHYDAENEKNFKEAFKDFKTHFIRPLTLEEVALLANKPLEGTPLTFTDDAVKELLQLSGGRPLEVNTICQRLIANKYQATYRTADIKELLEKMSDDAAESFRRTFRNLLNDNQREIMKRLVQTKDVLPSRKFKKFKPEEIQALIDIGFVAKDKKKNTYRVNGILLKEFLSKAIEKPEEYL